MDLKTFYEKYKEPITYVFWGGATTLVNYAVYFLCTALWGIDYLVSNVAAWALAVLFAFAVNKAFVFGSKSWQADILLRELGRFFGARIFSGVAETVLLWLCVDIGGLDDGIIKILVSILVVILNYILSKLFIFQNRR